MISLEAKEIKKGIKKDSPGKDLIKTRKEWEDYALSLPLVEGTDIREESIAGVDCLWVTNMESYSDSFVLFVHGGGLVSGSSSTHREFSSRFVKESSIPMLLINFSLAPENPYPEGLNDLVSVYRELVKKYDNKKIYIAGDSSGAGLAMALILKLRDEGDSLPGKFVSISGSFDGLFSGESFTTRDEADPFTSKAVLEECFNWYYKGDDVKNPYISPYYGELTGLPESLFMVGDHEILLSDSLNMNKRIIEGGGSSRVEVYPQMWHVWPLYGDFKEAREAIAQIKEFLL